MKTCPKCWYRDIVVEMDRYCPKCGYTEKQAMYDEKDNCYYDLDDKKMFDFFKNIQHKVNFIAKDNQGFYLTPGGVYIMPSKQNPSGGIWFLKFSELEQYFNEKQT